MKYGMRERVSGAIILIALALIFVPMLFDEPAPRSERPQPVLTIEQPVPVERRDVPDPQPPASLGEIQMPQQAGSGEAESVETQASEPGEAEPTTSVDAAPAVAVQQPASQPETSSAPEAEAPRPDPIAELAQAASQRLQNEASATSNTTPERSAPVPASPGGEWAVQVGSFGEAGNAERLQARLQEQGFSAYSRRRDNGMTTVYVGPFDSSEAGERAISAIKQQVNEQGLLVRVRD